MSGAERSKWREFGGVSHMKLRRIESLTRDEMELYLAAVCGVLREHLQTEVVCATKHLEEAFELIPVMEERVWWTQRVIEELKAAVKGVDVTAGMDVKVFAAGPEQVQ